MATTSRLFHTQQVHYLRKTMIYSNETETNIGNIPSGSLILKPISGVHISTAFDATTTNVIDVGFSANPNDPNLLGTVMDLKSATFVPLDEAVGGYLVTADVTVTATISHTGAAASAGSAELVICYIPDNDG